MTTPDAWVEVNVVPADADDPERLLLDIVDPLVHEQLHGRIATWFYFWEPELRLRIRWAADAAGGRSELERLLDRARQDGLLAEWWEGNHGRRGERYSGEADFYGAELWELTARDWMSGSELALAIVKLESAGRLSKPREFHWQRRVHLYSNQLRADEIRLCLRQAHGYIDLYFPEDRRFAKVRRAIERLPTTS